MPISNVKVVLFFKETQNTRGGWTETFYASGSNLQDLNLAIANGALLPARAALMPSDFTLLQLRVGTVPPYAPDNPRGATSTHLFRNGGVIGNYPPGDRDPADLSEEVYDALKIRLESGVTRRIFLMRGLPTEVTTKSEGYNPGGPWRTRFESWAVEFNKIAQIRRVTYPTPIPIATVTINQGGKGLLLTFDPVLDGVISAIIPGTLVKTAGIVGGNFVNHLWRTTPSILTPHSLQLSPGRVNLVGTLSGGTLSVATVSYVANQFVTAFQGTKKATGRPFDVLRGRRSARRS